MFGLAVLTQDGFRNVGEVRSAQLVAKTDHFTLNGSVSTPSAEFTSANCFVFAVTNDGKAAPSLNFGGTQISWKSTIGNVSSVNFSIYLLRHK